MTHPFAIDRPALLDRLDDVRRSVAAAERSGPTSAVYRLNDAITSLEEVVRALVLATPEKPQ